MPRGKRARWIRALVGGIVCVVVPAASRLEGSAALAWAMYSRGDSLRIDLVTFDRAGHRRVANASALAEDAVPGAVSLLAGADHWRPGSAAVLRAHGDALADHACNVLAAARVELTLWERVDGSSAPPRATAFRRDCRP